MEITQILGIGAGVITCSSMIPQLIKIIKEKKAEDVSPVMLVILICGLGLWVAYGIMKEDWPIILTNSLSVLLNFAVLILRYKYNR